ncbi:dermonecrotic toxin domain-containing protein [Pseudomonas huanghezhanensis]|uniref:dermonecrotic toxin domain-containing protein n=1 Tax=Pseudomonas huanghezhanensis TaxID=3002903 RepID=UPI002285E554|nr:DUF6543 domain-containing protein [Pseudomonas sp. BSw22131]
MTNARAFATEDTPLIATPPSIVAFPPSFEETVDVELTKLLNRRHPGLTIDIGNTWLNLYELKLLNVPTYTHGVEPSPRRNRTLRELRRSINLRDSVIDFFLGALSFDDDQIAGLFTASNSTELSAQINLSHQQLIYIYDDLSLTLLEAFSAALIGYWQGLEDGLNTRGALFVEERVKAMRLEVQAGLAQRKLTINHAFMLGSMILYSYKNDPTTLKKHGVFKISLNAFGTEPTQFAGAFVISSVARLHGSPDVDAPLGPALLYSPNGGLEGFDSLRELAVSLSARINNSQQRDWFLSNATLRAVTALKALEDPVTPSMWAFTSLEGDFLTAAFLSQIHKQQSDFAHCVTTSRANGFKSRDFLDLMQAVLEPRYQFDNFLNLEWNDRLILQTSMPNWWGEMSTADKTVWLTSAKMLGNSILDIEDLTERSLTNPFSSDQTLAVDYADDLLRQALSKNKILITPENIIVTISYSPPPLAPYGPDMAVHQDASNRVVRQYSLKALITQLPSNLRLFEAHSIGVTTADGLAIQGMPAKFVEDLINQLNDVESIDRFLDQRLKTSVYAKSLKRLSLRLNRSQMRMGLLNVSRGTSRNVRDWIQAVIDSPQATTDRRVNEQKIVVKFFAINGVQLSNVLQIAPESDGVNQGIVLCTLNAPDAQTFRWFKDLDAAKIGFFDNPEFAKYLLLQIPIAQRPKALLALQMDQALKSYRFPDIFRYLPALLPLPSLLWDALSYVEQSDDFLEENYALKISHLTADAKAHLLNAREIELTDFNTEMNLALSVILVFLPAPYAIPLALGLSLYKAWDGFRAIEEHDYRGAAKEFLAALGYLASAGLSKLALAKSIDNFKPLRTYSAPLAKTIGPDGDPHISVISDALSISSYGYMPEATVLDLTKFEPLNVEGEWVYIRRFSNIFGDREIYRVNPASAGSLVRKGEFVANVAGHWRKLPYQASGISPQALNDADAELTRLIYDWPTSMGAITEQAKDDFVKLYLKLAESSADDYGAVVDYCSAGSAKINATLRAGGSSKKVARFLQQFNQLGEYQGQAFRATNVTRASFQRIQTQLGAIFADKGVQSTSVMRYNAWDWASGSFVSQNATEDTVPIFLIFDESLPKKILFTKLLGDHVAISPGQVLQLTAFKTSNSHHYAYFSAPSQQIDSYLDIYTGVQTPVAY